MQVWAVISQKGGSGKTTLALHLAIAAAAEGKRVLLIDIDPQRSADRWSGMRNSDSPAIVAGEAARLPDMLSTAKEAGADLVILDTAPRMERAALAAAKQANLVISPVRPTILDIPAAQDTIEMVKLAGGVDKAIVVLNATMPRTAEASDAVAIFTEAGVTLCPQSLGDRVDYQRALTSGKGVTEFAPKSKAAGEISAVYRWICERAKRQL